MEEKQTNIPEEEEGIDVIALIKSLWEGKWTIVIWTAVFMVLGLVAALTMQRKYSVSTVMVPQVDSGKSSSLSSLASLAGFDLSSMTSGSELSPLIYPQIVNSVPFRKELMYTPLHYEGVDTAVSMFMYDDIIFTFNPFAFSLLSDILFCMLLKNESYLLNNFTSLL